MAAWKEQFYDFVGTDPTERPFYKGFVFLAACHALRRAFF